MIFLVIFPFVFTMYTGILRTHNLNSSQLALIAQLLEHCTFVAEVLGSNFTDASVVCITEMIKHVFMSFMHLKYMVFHIFTYTFTI